MDQENEPKVLLVAAEAREFAGLLARRPGAKLNWPLAFSRKCRDWILVANGPGYKLAGRAFDEAAARVRVRAVISTGFCGALDREFEIGDLVVGSQVSADGWRATCKDTPVQGAGRVTSGVIASVNRVAVTADNKRVLRETGACAVEMEAGVIAAKAEALGVPFFCIRAVSDQAGEDLPLDFNKYRDREGRFSRLRIALAAVRNPSSIRGLRRMDRNCRLAADKLGAFLADCRF